MVRKSIMMLKMVIMIVRMAIVMVKMRFMMEGKRGLKVKIMTMFVRKRILKV